MNEPHITVVGNVAGPPRFRTTPAGIPVAASTAGALIGLRPCRHAKGLR